MARPGLQDRLDAALDAIGVAEGRMLVAVSGGRDSMVLLALLRRVASRRGLGLVVGHVNHGLRVPACDADQALVERVALEAGLPCHPVRVDPERARRDRSSRDRPSLEEAARDARRAALVELAASHGCRWIATAHHAGDQAETVLLRILRGTAPDGLAGMAPVCPRGLWVKPLLGAMPEAIEAWAREHGLEWREDASNTDRRFARNRLRHDFVPALEAAFNPRLLRTLGQLAEAERTDREWIESLVDEAAEEWIEVDRDEVRLAIDGWATLPEALARRLVRRALQQVGLGRLVSRVHLERTLAFLRLGRSAGGDKRIELPSGIVLARRRAAFRLRREPATDPGRREMDCTGNATVQGRD